MMCVTYFEQKKPANLNVHNVEHIARLLKIKDFPMKELDLTGNKIDDDGVRMLCEALKDNQKLQALILGLFSLFFLFI